MDALDIVGVKYVWDMDDDEYSSMLGLPYLHDGDVVIVKCDDGSILVRAFDNGDDTTCQGCHFAVGSRNCAKPQPFRCGDCILVPIGA